MKTFFFIFSFLLIISCHKEKNEIQKPTFLFGNWIRTNEKDSLITYETWQKNFSGIGLTLKGKDTTFFEQMKILERKDSLFLAISGVNETTTLFKIIEQTDSSFVSENLKNDFPKKIKYFLEKGKLKATISNNDFKVDFIFERIKNND